MEVIPQAFCLKHGLTVGANLVRILREHCSVEHANRSTGQVRKTLFCRLDAEQGAPSNLQSSVNGSGLQLEVFTPDVVALFAVRIFFFSVLLRFRCAGIVEAATPSTETEPSTNPVCWGLSEMGARFSSRPSTSENTEYYSAHSQAMMHSRDQFSNDEAMEIEFSKTHWSEVERVKAAPQSAEEEELNRENKEVMKELMEEHPYFIHPDLDCFVLGRMIAKGGQAEVYAVRNYSNVLMKVFKRGTSLRALRGSFPLPVLNRKAYQTILRAGMLKDGRFAFLMNKCWGDLRKLIDQAMQEKNVDGIQVPPFPYKLEDFARETFRSMDLMYGIAIHMLDLNEEGISHRDLKASNILIQIDLGFGFPYQMRVTQGIIVADFECSIGVLGTGFWRAPEILAAIQNQETVTDEQWKQADVYSYGMICFEIVTGRIPFDGELENTKANRKLVIEGRRPQLPSDLDGGVKDLITKCWESNPSSRPTFLEIADMIETMCTKQCQFRLFGIGDELPPQYQLATVQEVNENPTSLMRAMPGRENANLANGSVGESWCGREMRLERRIDADYKLARLHH